MNEDFRKNLPNTYVVLDKMCKMVGVNVDEFEFCDGWFWKHEWTAKQEADFIEWLTEYLKSRDAMKEMTRYGYVSDKHRKEVAKAFVHNYGWRIKDVY